MIFVLFCAAKNSTNSEFKSIVLRLIKELASEHSVDFIIPFDDGKQRAANRVVASKDLCAIEMEYAISIITIISVINVNLSEELLTMSKIEMHVKRTNAFRCAWLNPKSIDRIDIIDHFIWLHESQPKSKPKK